MEKLFLGSTSSFIDIKISFFPSKYSFEKEINARNSEAIFAVTRDKTGQLNLRMMNYFSDAT